MSKNDHNMDEEKENNENIVNNVNYGCFVDLQNESKCPNLFHLELNQINSSFTLKDFKLVFSLDNSFYVLYSSSSIIVLNNENEILYKQMLKSEEVLVSVKIYCRKICMCIYSSQVNYLSIMDSMNFTNHFTFTFDAELLDFFFLDHYFIYGKDKNNPIEETADIRILLLTKNFELIYIVNFQTKDKLFIEDLFSKDEFFGLNSDFKIKIDYDSLCNFFYLITSKGNIYFIDINDFNSEKECLSVPLDKKVNVFNYLHSEYRKDDQQIKQIKQTKSKSCLINDCHMNVITFILSIGNKSSTTDFIWYLISNNEQKFINYFISSFDSKEIIDTIFAIKNESVYILYLSKSNDVYEVLSSDLENDLKNKKTELSTLRTISRIYPENVIIDKKFKHIDNKKLRINEMRFVKSAINFEGKNSVIILTINYFLRENTNIFGSLIIYKIEKPIKNTTFEDDKSISKTSNILQNNLDILRKEEVIFSYENMLASYLSNQKISLIKKDNSYIIVDSLDSSFSKKVVPKFNEINEIDMSTLNGNTIQTFFKSLCSELIKCYYENDFIEEFINKNLIKEVLDYRLIFYVICYDFNSKKKINELTSENRTVYQLRPVVSSSVIHNVATIVFSAISEFGFIKEGKISPYTSNILLGVKELLNIILYRYDHPYFKLTDNEVEAKDSESILVKELLKKVEKVLLLINILDQFKDEEKLSTNLEDYNYLNEINNIDQGNDKIDINNPKNDTFLDFKKSLEKDENYEFAKIFLESFTENINNLSNLNNRQKSNILLSISSDMVYKLIKDFNKYEFEDYELFLYYSLYVFKNNLNALLLKFKKNNKENCKDLNINTNIKEKIALILKNIPSKMKFKYCLSYYDKFFKFALAVYRLSFLLSFNQVKDKNNNRFEDKMTVMYITSAIKEEIVYITNKITTKLDSDGKKGYILSTFEYLLRNNLIVEASNCLDVASFSKENTILDQIIKLTFKLKIYFKIDSYFESHIEMINFLQRINFMNIEFDSNNFNNFGYQIKEKLDKLLTFYIFTITQKKELYNFLNAMPLEFRINFINYMKCDRNFSKIMGDELDISKNEGQSYCSYVMKKLKKMEY